MRVRGAVRPPGDKSISHRALLLAALAHGRSELDGLLTGADVKSTARVLRQLGVDISPVRGGGPVRVRGRNVRSEEHTSELQSRSDLVCRLLLEKKKTH